MPDPINSYETATKIRNLEIKLFWQRSNYFLVLNTAIATGALLKIDSPEYAFPLSLFGFLVSLMWISINLGSKFWQDRWERKIAKIELNIDSSLQLFAVPREVVEQEVKESLRYDERKWYRFWERIVNFLVMLKPSVSRTMILLSFTFALFWVAMALNSMGFHPTPPLLDHRAGAMNADTLTLSPLTSQESHSIGFFSWDSLWNFIAVVLGILLSFWIERKRSERQSRTVQKSLVSLIADEVERNIQLMTQIVEEAQKTIVPYYQLVTENRDACWPMLVEYPFSDNALIKQVGKSYFEYRLINRTLDMLFFKEGLQSPIFKDSTLPLCRAEIDRSKKLLIALRDWAIK